MTTYYMYFPFFSSEVRCGCTRHGGSSEYAQHYARSSRVQACEARERSSPRDPCLFRLARSPTREDLCYYPVIDDNKKTIWRHLIHGFSFNTLDGKRNGRRTSLSRTSMIYRCLLISKDFARLSMHCHRTYIFSYRRDPSCNSPRHLGSQDWKAAIFRNHRPKMTTN